MNREIQIGAYKVHTEKNKYGAYKCTVCYKGNLTSEFWGPTEYISIIKALNALHEGNKDYKALLITLLEIGYTDGYEAGADKWGLEEGLNEIKEIYSEIS